MSARPAADTFQIVATLPSLDGKPERYVGKCADGEQFAVLHKVAGHWAIKAGPWTFAVWAACAERCVAGDARALTWSDAQMCLAAGALVFLSGVNAAPADNHSAGSLSLSPADDAPPPVSLPSSDPAAAPTAHHCHLGHLAGRGD
jgi:hypothetical protein